jgi:hypothetical protein
MPLTDPTQVQNLLQLDYDATEAPDLTLYINAADYLVNDLCTNSGYDTQRLTLLETLLACHFYRHKDRQTISESISGAVSIAYARTENLFLEGSKYGEWAIELDTAGTLAAYQKKLTEGQPQASIIWLGNGCDDD